MIARLWLRRLAGSSGWKTAGAAAGVALAVSLLGTLGAFLSASFSVMTSRAIAGVPVDWQVQFADPGVSRSFVRALAEVTSHSRLEPVEYADVLGLTSSARATVQTTGAGVVVGLPSSYGRSFPGELRILLGAESGVLLAQQTAANLRARVGDRISVVLPGARARSARVDGIVDLPFADSFFQTIGLPASAARQAPPDNVLIVPAAVWHRWFDAQARQAPGSVRFQLHVRISHELPHDPNAALTAVTSAAHGVELRAAGTAAIGDNLAAQLQSTREDAIYARLLFLFLGLPGAVLAMLVAASVIESGAVRRRREAALLRIRGATARRVRGLTALEALIVSVLGSLAGLGLTLAAARWWLGNSDPTSAAAVAWTIVGCGLATLLVFGAYLFGTVTTGTAVVDRKAVGPSGHPLWRRIYLDWILLAIAGLAFWKTAATGYQIVVAPEGVPQASVSYDAFVAPVCLWLGAGLLTRRLSEAGLARRGAMLERLLSPFAGPLAAAIAATLSRERASIGRAVTSVALAMSFAISTAAFNATYNTQALVDAELTNGADIAVTMTAAAPVDALAKRLSGVDGVASIDTIQHRFAYVGQDLQDFFGIDALTIGRAAHMSDAYFANGDARATLGALAARPDGALVSAETVNDFQLRPGDRLNLRLQFARDGQYHVVPFTFVGVVREFPTAPHDSFILANAGYVSRATGSTGPLTTLIRASGDPSVVAKRVRAAVSGIPAARVSDINEAVRSVGSSLTSVDLRGLTAVELSFALVLMVGVAGLSLALGFSERRRNYAILAALGANPRQLGAFLWSEGSIILLGGFTFGAALGFALAQVLVKVLTGVFDPPPTALTIPWLYLLAIAAIAVAATAVAVIWSAAAAQRDPVRALR